jgi:hypothetical protein
MRKRILVTLCAGMVLLFAASVFLHYQSGKAETKQLDLTEHLELSFTGANGKGRASVYENDLSIGNDQNAKGFAESLEYRILPTGSLSNGDTITVTVFYDEELAETCGYSITNTTKKFEVEGLVCLEDAVESTNEKDMAVEIISGVEIPASWNLSDDEKAAYVQYMLGISEDNDPTASSETGTSADEWIQGSASEETFCEDKTFSAYSFAYSYGINSSQLFRIVPSVEESGTVKYRCEFKNPAEASERYSLDEEIEKSHDDLED